MIRNPQSLKIINMLSWLADPKRRLAFAEKMPASYLNAGFTGIRDLGNSGTFMDIKIRDAKPESAPRIYASGMGLAYRNGGNK